MTNDPTLPPASEPDEKKAAAKAAAERLKEVTKSERDKVAAVLDSARKDVGAQFASSGREVYDALDSYVKISTWKCLAGAALIGYLAGRLCGGCRCRR